MIRRTSKIAVVIAASAFALINTTYAIEIAEDLLIELDAEDASADTGIWVNTGSEGGNFIAQGNPLVEQADGDLGTGGARGLNFNSTGTLDVYVSDFDAPAGIIGVDPTRSVEVWVLNPNVAGTESMVAWSGRGINGDGGNMSFNYGTGKEGAVTQWSGTDLNWAPIPQAGVWHHLVYTYDGNTTRVYADGVLNNSEFLGAGAINTAEGKIAIGTQFDGNRNPAASERSSLTIALVRIHDGVLSDAQVLMNYEEEKDRFTTPQFVPRRVLPGAADLNDFIYADQTEYSRPIAVSGEPIPELSIEVDPAQDSASITGVGGVTRVQIDVTEPPPSSFEVTVTATNEVAGAPQEFTFAWTVDVRPTLQRGDVIQVARELYVDLDAADPSAGTETWVNKGTADDFFIVGDPVSSDLAGVPTVSFNMNGGENDAYVTGATAPPGLVGENATSTIEVWVFNPTIEDEESLVSWSKRGSSGRNMSFNYGNNGTWGAASRWNFDMAWLPLPAAGEWHLLTLTYDGVTQAAYADGVFNRSQDLGAGTVNIFDGIPITLGNQRVPDGSLASNFRLASLHIGRVRVHDGVLKPEQIMHNFVEEACEFIPSAPFGCTQNLLFLDDQIVPTGASQVTVPVGLNTTTVRHAVSLSITYDPARLALANVDLTGTVSEGAASVGRICNDLSGGCTRAGAMVWSLVLGLDIDPDGFDPSTVIPFGDSQVIANLVFDIVSLRSEVSTDIEFTDELFIAGVPGKNALVTSSIKIQPALDGGTLTREQSDGTVFRRGDCDQSGRLDFNDAVFHLQFLFLGENEETVNSCRDACDSDDSGTDDFTDDINSLRFLFLGEGDIPSPGPQPDESQPCGLDPTEDDEADCVQYDPTIACP